ncbi:MAG: PQQ-binding-like beta-propeller repeat protein [Lysobacterales bacterium]|jgi:alcohol dehydrogenase (cytochrome c)
MKRSKSLSIFGLASTLCAVLFVGAAAAAVPDGTGKAIYDQHCAECHGMRLRGSGHGSELAGPNFISKWGNRPVSALFAVTAETMPAGQPGSLSESANLAILRYMLSANGAAGSLDAVQPDSETAVGVLIKGADWKASMADASSQSWEKASSIADAARKASGFVNQPIENFRPVTGAMLALPDPGDWLSWRRTLDGQGFSPLKQVTRENVGKLKLAWVIAMRDGSNQTTPLVHEGIMYLVNPQNVIQAIDAATGDVIWEYANTYPPESETLGGPTRTIALYEDKVFMATYDAALVAVDAKTGKQVWKTVKADWKEGYTHTSGPIIAGGVVVSGINGCERYKKGGCFVTGHDPDTGKELWRLSTIALPGDPNDASWGGLPVKLRAGGDTWIPGSYDPGLGLFYIGTAQAKPWVAASRGMSPLDAALYTDSTLAIDPKTGKLVWYYQHVPGESLDMEPGFERVLVDLDGRKELFTIGKDGILWKLDRKTGRFIDFVATLPQNIFKPLDRKTGRLHYRQDIIDAKIGEPVNVCPGIYGGHNWQASAYYPATHSLIIPLHQLCAEMTGREVKKVEGYGGYGGDSTVYPMPGANGMLGKLVSYDLDTMKQKWAYQQRAMFLTGALTTAGGLVFIGDLDRYFKAFDADTGKELWKVRLGAGLHGFPISYAVNGKQYIAVPTGMGVFKLLTAMQEPEIYQPNGGNALYVFTLPDAPGH